MVLDDYTWNGNSRISEVVQENQEEIREKEELFEKMLVAAWGDLSERLKPEFEARLAGTEESIEECDQILGRGE